MATTNLSGVERVEEILANQTQDGIRRTSRIPIEKLALQLAGTAPLNALAGGAAVMFETKLDMDASLDHEAPLAAWVFGDAAAGNNGIYIFVEGTPNSWQRKLDLPFSQIKLTDAGAGTANAIIATSLLPLPTLPYLSLLLLAPHEANTGPVTIAVNGASAKTLKTNSGQDLQADYLQPGMLVAFVDAAEDFRLLSDVASAAIQAAAEEAVADALAIYGSIAAVAAAAAGATADAATASSASAAAQAARDAIGDTFSTDVGEPGGTDLATPAAYLLAASLRGSGQLNRLFGRILDGTGSLALQVTINEGIVLVNQLLEAGTDLTVEGMEIDYAQGDELRIEVTDIIGSVKWAWLQLDGMPQ